MPLRILIAESRDFTPDALRLLRQVGEVELAADASPLVGAFAEFDVIWIRLGHRIDSQMIGHQPRCRFLVTPVTGLDHIDLKACALHGIQVLSLRGETEFLRTVRATAELTLALTLSLIRMIPSAVTSVQSGRWQRDLFRGHELFGRVAGIVGLGRLGTIVASYFRAMGMRVLAFDPRDDFPANAAERANGLHELLELADVVSVHVDYKPTTYHLIGSSEFARIKPTAVLVNTSRGGVVNDSALLDALLSRQIAGAALDVLEGEPDLARSNALIEYSRSHSNLIITPHLGGNTFESFEKTERFLAEKLLAAIERSSDRH